MSRKHTGFRLAAQLIVLPLTVLFFSAPVWAQNLEVNVESSQSGPLSGLKVYAFTESGSYTGKYATTDGSGTALFDLEDFADGTYKFRVDYLGSQFWSQVITIPGATAVEVVIEEETVEVMVTTVSGPVEGVRVYLFSESGSYLDIYEVTDSAGMVCFDLPVGKAFKFRADILGGQYWSDVITISGGGMNSVSVNAGGGFLQVTVEKAPDSPMEGIKVYLFSQSGSYLGLYEVTDASGIVGFSVPEGIYKVRADYLGYQFWSEEAQVIGDTGMVLTIPHQPVEITVQGLFAGVPEPIVGINVYLFNPAGSYLSQNLQTNASGKVTFELPERAFKVRADYLGQQFWSEEFAWQNTTVNVPMADAEITVTGAGFPQQGVKVYLFSAAGSYLSLNETTDIDGKVAFRVPEGAYKFRVDYQGSQYWNPEETLAADQVNYITISVGGGSFTVTIQTDTTEPLVGVKCYVFNESGTYLGLFGATDSNGDVSFDLADGTYKFRADYLGSQFWSEVVTVPDVSTTSVIIEEETVEVTVTSAAGPAEGIRVYLFSESGSYLGIYEVTDENGRVTFDLPVGKNFKFRADTLGNQYWSDVITVLSGGVNNVSVNAGGGLLQVTVEKAPGSAMAGIKVYLFSQSGRYLGLYEVTDASGVVGFDVPQGTFKVRADYLGYQFWSAETIVTGDTNMVLTIPHQPVEVTVQAVFQGVPEPIEGIKVYLFSSAGSYLGQYQQTNSSGKVTFDLPEKAYKVRADYLGQQFWSEEFTWQGTAVNVPMADADITVTGAGFPQEGLKVYVFSAAGSYLGLYDTTDNDGKVTFRIPEGAYKFRADEGGGQYWSGAIDIVAGQVNSVAIEIDVLPVTVSISADPETILLGESSTLTWSSADADSCVIEPGIGSVDMTGSISVSPTETTTYTITATGPGGTATATVTVTVTYPGPSVGISANPETILLGESSTLTWSSTDADSCVIEPGIGSVGVTGSILVSPTETTAYTITATGRGGSAMAAVSVTVTYPQPTVSISADPGTILQGEPSTLTWSSTHADLATIDQGIGTVEPNDSTTVSPTETIMYTITVTGPGGTATDTVTVTVTSPTPTVTLSADPETIQLGGSSTLTWSSTDADSCVIEPDIGSVDVTGSTAVSPTETTTYTITATGPGGTATANATVTVNYPPSITVVEPDGVDDTADTTFTIQWSDADPDDDAPISLYYDTDNSGADGTLIVSGLSEDLDGSEDDAYIWDTTEVAEGTYYVYAMIDDGLNDLVVDYSSGVVTIDHVPSSTEIKIAASDAAEDDRFGYSVSISGDYAIAGAYQDDDAGSNSGAAYIFKREGFIWTEQTKLTPSSFSPTHGRFGTSVSISGDYAIVGADGDPGGWNIGAAYIFKREGSDWIQQARMVGSSGNDYFGKCVSINGEYAIVGARGDDWYETNSGAAYIYKRESSGWIRQSKLKASNAQAYDYFGSSVAISDDYAIVGVPYDDDGGVSGSVYVFKQEDSGWTEEIKLTASDATEVSNFGSSVGISGDYVIVGCTSSADGGVYIFKRENSIWIEQAKITSSGRSVAITGDYAIVGRAGTACIFKRDGSDWTEQNILTGIDTLPSDYFGNSVAISNAHAIVGAYGNDDDGSFSGSAYIYSFRPVSIVADPDTIQIGESSTLFWYSNNADSCVIAPDIGNVAVNGWTDVSPTEMTTYTITATGPGGTATDNVTVTVTFHSPTVSLNAEPDTIQVGDSSTLTWSSTYADSCTIEPGIGNVDVNGSISVSPIETTTYIITATGPGGTATDGVTVTVTYPLPTVNISADPEAIVIGESSTLAWSSTHADSCVIEPDIGTVDPNGSTTTSPTGTTTYIIIATGPGGTATDTVTVTVLMGIITGTVTDATTSHPVADVTVNVTDSHKTQTAHTGTTGEYQIEGIRPGAITVTFTKDEYVPVEKNLSIAADETLTLNISLYEILPGATLIGTVKDKITGQPLQGAIVSAKDSDKTQSVQTLEGGSYTITGITPCIVEITAALTGYFPETGQFDLPAEQFYTLDLELYSESTLVTVYGTITNSTTLQPEPGVSIMLEGTDISDATLENGTFTLEDVPMGEQSLKVVKEDFCYFIQPVNINQDPFEVNLIFPLIPVSPYPAEIDTTITGYVHDAVSGQGLNGAIVRIYGTSIQATTDPDGQYTLTDLPAGAITLIAMALNHEAVLVCPTVVPGASDTFQFNLPPTTKGVITGKVTNADTGEPIRHTRILIGENSLLSTESEADGIYTLVGTPGGSYSVTAMHPEYVTAESDPIVVEDAMTTTVDFALTHRPEIGDLEGPITDKDTGDPIIDAILTVQGTSITTSTNSNGYYKLSDLPAGLVTIAIDADGYPSTTRTKAVVAHEDDATPTTTIFDIELDASDPTPPDSISELIIAEDGGSIESPDIRFMIVIPPGALSGDAIVTLMSPTDGPEVYPGDDLVLDHGLGLSDIKALGRMTQVVLEPAIPGEEIPTIQGWVLISGRYFQSEVDEFDIAESSIFPYYWDGTQWTIMRVKSYEMAVDRINNMPVTVVDFSTTATGNPVTAQLGTREPILLASLDDHIPNLDWALKFLFGLGGGIEIAIPPQPNVKTIDKDELDAVTQNPDPKKTPNTNALPLVVIHGWDWKTIFGNAGHTDPNEGINPDGTIDPSKANRYTYIVKDLVDATNGVYRPMFVTHNSRAGMVSIGNDMANKLLPSDIQGKPAEPGDDSSGRFSYLDTFSYSMGGLIARNYQVHTGGVQNMVMAGTPNHGTFSFVEYLNHLYGIGELVDVIKNWSPGTADLLDYDDQGSVFWSTNPRLHRLNQNPRCAPLGDMTLIAGTEKGSTGNILFPPSTENDGAVPVESVFCRTSNPDDGLKSLLEVQQSAKVYESIFEFNHFNFGGENFKIKDNPAVENAITHGFSDWVVTKLVNAQVNKYEPDLEYIEYAEFEVAVEYNVFKPNAEDLLDGRESRDIDRLALVIYAKDENGQWYVSGNYVDAQGNVTYSNSIEGNSKNVEPPLTISTNALFPESDKITDLAFEVIRLKPGQETVPLEPKGDFGLPE